MNKFENNALSIIIPTWNRKDILYRLILKLTINFKQINFKNYEILIIDSNSTDNTKFAIHLLVHNLKKNKIKVLQSKINSIALKRNIGIKKSVYNNILLLDDDCVLTRNNLLKVIRYLKTNNTNKKNIFCGQYFTRKKLIDKSNYYFFRNSANITTNKIYKKIKFNNIITGFCFFNKTALITNKVLFDSTIKGYGIEDIEWAKRLEASNFRLRLTNAFCWHDETSSNIINYSYKWYMMARDVYSLLPQNVKENINLDTLKFAEFLVNFYISKFFFNIFFFMKLHAILKYILYYFDNFKVFRMNYFYKLVLKLYFVKGLLDKNKSNLSSMWYNKGYK